MSSGTLCLIVSLVSLAGLGILHKVADFRRCKPSAINVTLFFWASVVLWSYTLVYKVLGQRMPLFPPFTLNAVFLAAVCGTCATIAILTFQIGIRYGRISTSWLVINLSTAIPTILSLIMYKEWERGVKWSQLTGLVLVVVSVLLLWRDKALEIARGEQPVPQQELPELDPLNLK